MPCTGKYTLRLYDLACDYVKSPPIAMGEI